MTQKRHIHRSGRIKGKPIGIVLIGLITFAALLVMMAFFVTPSKYDIVVGEPAPDTIKATKDITDEITTRAKRDAAEKAVGNKYTDVPGAAENVKNQMETVFAVIKAELTAEDDGEETDSALKLARLNSEIKLFEISGEEFEALSGMEPEKTEAAFSAAVQLVQAEMSQELREDGLAAAKERIFTRLGESGYPEAALNIACRAVEACLKANYIYDDDATRLARMEARDKVEEVVKVKGEAITKDGEFVTEEQYAMLKTLGMVQESTFDLWLYLGIFLMILSLMLAVCLYIFLFESKRFKSIKSVLMLSIICVLTILFCVLGSKVNIYIMPVTFAVFMIALLINRRVALFINIPLSVMASILASASESFFNMTTYTVIISSLVSAAVILWFIKNHQTRVSVLLAGFLGGIAEVITTFAVGLINSSSLMNSLYIALYSGLGGILSALLCVVCMPAFEVVFNAVTTTRLIELSNPNQPLLRRLLMEAPGTYHHSIIVANLAEAAAGEIGANGLLARVGAYYHDLGKIKRPMYFTENQVGDNPHDRTDPRVSTAIITAHPIDGLVLLKESRIPDEIKKIVISHHGNTPVVYFYNKSLNENGEANVDDFRYNCPKPATKEEVVVMLADTVEAASRSLPSHDPESIRELVFRLVHQKIDDNQLDECAITFADVKKICDSFVTVLSGAYHERVEYPTVDIPRSGEKAQ